MDDLDRTMWTELATFSTISPYRRALQRYYVDKLVELSKNSRDIYDADVVIRNKKSEVLILVKKALTRTKDAMTVYHLRYLQDRLEGK
jgi:hypothetical protein